MDISLRKALESDIDFLVELRDSTMREHLQQAGMSVSEDEYLNRVTYKFDCARIVELDGIPVGLFKAEFQQDRNQWYLIQIQIHPGYQNLKIGSSLVSTLIDIAKASGSGVGLSVIKSNPAYKLYQRLGFKKVGENQFEYELERPAEAVMQ